MASPQQNSSSSYYFANDQINYRSSGDGNYTTQNMDKEDSNYVQQLPQGSKVEEFYSRPVVSTVNSNHIQKRPALDTEHYLNPPSNILSPNSYDHLVGSLLLERKVPVKIDPKSYFANERLFLLWMHSSLWLFGASTTILSFSHGDAIKIMYGATIMPVALSFIFYSIYQYIKKTRMMRQKLPYGYEDLVGPSVLGVLLCLAIIGQFTLRLLDPFSIIIL